MNIKRVGIIISIVVISLLLVSCKQNSAPDSVLAYLQALTMRDENQLALLSCAAWEAQSKTELEAFSALTVTLEDASCEQNGIDGEYTLVSCSGKIVANYGNEILEINLADRTYQAIYEGGEWRMCGYR